ncbi:MAG: NAD(P)-dependent oxidoreductase [Candidatus Eremiobacteraeota bacterium]|nr:NAD(P)-dependent oxidoreductase [Candidatus Eremiobacteraeota bacterium]
MNDTKASDLKSRVAVVGVGRMGAGIALRLRDVGYAVTAVYDVYAEAAEKIAQETGATAVRTLAEVCGLADVIVTVVTDDAAMESIFAESGDSLLTGAKGKIFINTATVTPNVHAEMERRAQAHGAAAIEACMASSIPQARNGELYLIVAGDRAVFERVRPMLEKLSASLRFVGPAGSAAQVKALVNMVMNVNTAGLAEGLGLADALGLDLGVVREVFSQTGANSRVLETDGLDMQNREHDVYFSAAHAAKDSHIAVALARAAGLHLPLAETTAAQYDRMKELGLGELDKSGIAELTFRSRRASDVTALTS